MTQKKRIGELDLLRFVFIIMVVLHHFETGTSPYGISVEFFFTLAGLLMARHAEKWDRSTDRNGRSLALVADETWSFMKGKLRAFYKYYLCAFALNVIVRSILVNHVSAPAVVMRLLKSIPTVTLSFFAISGNSTGFYLSASWFLSAMLIAMFILYPILLRSYRFSVKILFPILTLFLLGFEFAANKTIGVWSKWTGFTYFGILRAASEIAFGASLYYVSTEITGNEMLMKIARHPLVKAFFTLVKACCYAVALLYAHKYVFGHKFSSGFDLHALFFVGIGILLSFSGLGWSIPDSKAARYLGKISLPIYIFHNLLKSICMGILGVEELSPEYNWLMVVVCVIGSVVLMYVTDFAAQGIHKLWTALKEKLLAYVEARSGVPDQRDEK